MKKFFLFAILLSWILTACAPRATEQSILPNDGSYPSDAYPNDDSYPSDSADDLTPAQQAAVTLLSSTFNLPREQITLISTEAVEWPDGCLGIQRAGMMCTQAIVPGYRIILEADSRQYEIHTDEDGSAVALAPSDSDSSLLEQALIEQLASNLGLKESDILVVSSSNVEFADSCFGVAMNDMLCAQAITPGKIVVLESNGVQYEYHVSDDGMMIQPATIALAWTRDGGIAGFCDRLTVFLSGEIYGERCGMQPNGAAGTFATMLSAEEREQLNAWINELGQVNIDASDPKDVSDRMVVELTFYGNGKGALNKSDEQALMLWAQTVHQKLYS